MLTVTPTKETDPLILWLRAANATVAELEVEVQMNQALLGVVWTYAEGDERAEPFLLTERALGQARIIQAHLQKQYDESTQQLHLI